MNADVSFKAKRLTESQMQQLLDRLDQADHASNARDKRISTRLSFRRTQVKMRITQPGGGVSECQVVTRNISATGCSLLYWGFLHVGTEVRLHLKRRSGGDEAVDGHVVWCKHIIGPHHALGIRFLSKIFPKDFVDPGDWTDRAAEGQISPGSLTGNVLLIDDQEMDRMLMGHQLKPTNIKFHNAADLDAGLKLLKSHSIDTLLLEMNLGGTTIEQSMRKCRDGGYSGPIIVVTAESSPPRLAAAEKAGAVAVLQKPYEPDKLLGVLSLWLNNGEAAGEDAIVSDLRENQDMLPLIEQYVKRVREMVGKLQQAIQADELATARNICQSLKGSGNGFGYPTLSAAAKDAVTSLDASTSIAASASELQRLESMCRRLAVGKAA